MSVEEITPRQFEYLRWIVGYITTQRMSPSLHEIAQAMGASSKTAAWWVVNRLIDHGALERIGEGSASNLRLTRDGLAAVHKHELDHELLDLLRHVVASGARPSELNDLAAALRARGYHGEGQGA